MSECWCGKYGWPVLVSGGHTEYLCREHMLTTRKEKQVDMQERLDRDFTYHAPKGDQQECYVALRAKAKELAELIVASTPASREQSIALTELETAVFWANAAIARNE